VEHRPWKQVSGRRSETRLSPIDVMYRLA
jgi:hypothetical protein